MFPQWDDVMRRSRVNHKQLPPTATNPPHTPRARSGNSNIYQTQISEQARPLDINASSPKSVVSSEAECREMHPSTAMSCAVPFAARPKANGQYLNISTSKYPEQVATAPYNTDYDTSSEPDSPSLMGGPRRDATQRDISLLPGNPSRNNASRSLVFQNRYADPLPPTANALNRDERPPCNINQTNNTQ